MRFTTEPSGLKIGVDGSIMEAFESGYFGVRMNFENDDKTSRYNVVLTVEETLELIKSLKVTLENIDDAVKVAEELKGIGRCVIKTDLQTINVLGSLT